MKKNVLFIYASYGSGHKSVSNYVREYFEKNGDYNIISIDLIEYINLFGKIGFNLFNFNVSHGASKTFTAVYEILDKKMTPNMYNKFCMKSFDNAKLRKIIANFKPDLTISSHFFGSYIINEYNKMGICHSKILTILTDYKSHKLWEINLNDQDAIIVGNDIVRNELINKGMVAKKIHSYGIPLNISYTTVNKSKEQVFKDFKFDSKKKTCLFFGGGSDGYMLYYDYLKKLVKNDYDFNIIFVSGKNEKLKEKASELVIKNRCKNVVVLGFVNDVFSLYNACDMVISKSGGATVTECLETKKPMIILPGVGGQENYNAKFMERKGYGIRCKSLFKFNRVMKKIEYNDILLNRLQSNINKENHNQSIKNIFKLSVSLLKKWVFNSLFIFDP